MNLEFYQKTLVPEVNSNKIVIKFDLTFNLVHTHSYICSKNVQLNISIGKEKNEFYNHILKNVRNYVYICKS